MVSCGIRTPFGILSPCEGKVAHALLTRPPLKLNSFQPKPSVAKSPLDLHVLGTPPAFVLSQDQTLKFNPSALPFSNVSNSQNQLSFFLAFLLLSVSFSRFGALEGACLYYHSNSLLSTPFLNFSGVFFILLCLSNFNACTSFYCSLYTYVYAASPFSLFVLSLLSEYFRPSAFSCIPFSSSPVV